MLGGMVTAPLLSMFVIPAAYKLMRQQRPRTQAGATEPVPARPLHVAARR
jgi:Cu(I)/Ag(I) efflux system membrane protein CusA/SilA